MTAEVNDRTGPEHRWISFHHSRHGLPWPIHPTIQVSYDKPALIA
ncbi:hypothetical protein GFS31_04000 [Leptolyngbya sp. BL0902]|nr:hypothetical protein GFS31_04000 [Leptolyngbya sp. BL0902]